MKVVAQNLDGVNPTANGQRVNEQLMKVSREFESILTNRMLSVMRQTVPKDGLVPQSHAEKVYESLLDNEYSKTISETDQLGLARMIYEHLLRTVSTK